MSATDPTRTVREPAPDLPDWITRRLPAGVERFRVPVGDGLSMHVQVLRIGGEPEEDQEREPGSEAGPPVLLLHGNPTWSFLWRKVADRLAARRLGGAPATLVMPDLVGLGLSDRLPDVDDHQLARHARHLGACLDALPEIFGPDAPGGGRLVFVGQDWGGPVGLRMLVDRIEARSDGSLDADAVARTVAGLVILNTVVSEPKPDFRATTFHRLARLPVVSTLLFRGIGFPQCCLWLAQGDRGSIRGAVSRAYRWPLRGWSNNAAPLALARMVPDSMEHPSVGDLRRCRELVEAFDGPAEIVWGDRDPVLGKVRSWVEKLLPGAEVTRTKAGHFLQEEVPDEIAAAVDRVVGRAFDADPG